MFKKNTKRVFSLGLSFILVLVLAIGIISSEKAHAASFSDINDDTMFFKQNTSSTCTLASAAMLVRRAALLDGNSSWTGVTENNLKSTAWKSGVGLYNSFSYTGINVSSAKISSNRTQTMINLLSQHPEGVVIYDFGKPHAILLTDYTNGTFYCSDPSSAAPAGRIPISQATITLESVDKYWYVASPKLSMSVTQPVNIKPTVGNIQIMSSNGYTSFSCQVTTGMGGAWAAVEYIRDGVRSDPISAEIINGTVSGHVSRFSSTLTVKVTVTDQAGNTASNSTSVDYGEPIRLSANRLSLTAGESDRIQLFCTDLYELNEKHGYSHKLSDGRIPVELSDEGVVSAHLPGLYVLQYHFKFTQYNPPGSIIQPAMIGIGNCPIIVDVRLESPVVQTLSADTAGNVYIDFSSARGADGYEVCRISEDGKISETVRVSGSGKQCVGHDLPDDTKWNYKVRAYTILPEETSYSGRFDPITGKVPTYMPEETVYSDWTQMYNISIINLATTMEPTVNNILGSITVSWKEVPSAEGYLVYRTEGKDDANRKLLTIAEAGEMTYMDNTVIPGTVYRYEIIPYLGMEFGICDNTITVCAKVENSGEGEEQPGTENTTTYTYKLNDDKNTITITKCTLSDENVAIPSVIDGYTVTGIDDKAFQNITSMKTVSFPSTLKNINNYAFAGCTSLTTVTLPDSLTELGTYVFQGCVVLQSAKLNLGRVNISEGLFQGCTLLSSVTLPDMIQYIRQNAFNGCISLKTLSLPKSLSIVYSNAFLYSGINTIQYAGTNLDWQNVIIGTTGNTSFLNATVIGSNGKTFSANKSKWDTSNPAPVKKPTVSKVKSFNATAGKKKLTLTWKKMAGTAKYQIQISTKKNFKGAKTISVSKTKKAYTKKGLKAKKKYFVRIRAYKTYRDANQKIKKIYGKWVTIIKRTK